MEDDDWEVFVGRRKKKWEAAEEERVRALQRAEEEKKAKELAALPPYVRPFSPPNRDHFGDMEDDDWEVFVVRRKEKWETAEEERVKALEKDKHRMPPPKNPPVFVRDSTDGKKERVTVVNGKEIILRAHPSLGGAAPEDDSSPAVKSARHSKTGVSREAERLATGFNQKEGWVSKQNNAAAAAAVSVQPHHEATAPPPLAPPSPSAALSRVSIHEQPEGTQSGVDNQGDVIMEGREVAGVAEKNEIEGGQTEKERENEDITKAVAEAEGGVDDLIEKGKALQKGGTADWESHQEDLFEKFAEQQEVQMHYRAPTLLCAVDANTNKDFFKEKLLPLGMFDPNPSPMDPFLTMQQPLSPEAIAALRGPFTIRMTSELQGVATKIG
uniref:Uncharacterized protein n=1 Tax=Chromera velia CCMP2878 TaxID=1169474 RepID=A0A0G4I7F6_9ALVE|eukprot:Cvel_36503.t1-p1 / transcript=Cvel_36503.t1 / gene=Cvel_36503 / organism=Chromera_velia_CCMP2878 / gene_product=hypothetical protein / transcript_product=hypothetical protein / location=Cvel_scaffold7354:581-1729(-) / protein_length=383 / sequence_SO=supercontig / SO=protein_coding / is_pseudo=false